MLVSVICGRYNLSSFFAFKCKSYIFEKDCHRGQGTYNNKTFNLVALAAIIIELGCIIQSVSQSVSQLFGAMIKLTDICFCYRKSANQQNLHGLYYTSGTKN